MRHQYLPAGAVAAASIALTACAGTIPIEPVPEGWELNVHQPGQWWTQPLIPRSVVVDRCPPPEGWSSDPDLTTVTAVPPGSAIEYYSFLDDGMCSVGWSGASTTVDFTPEEMTVESGLRRICSSSGLPMDNSWTFVGVTALIREGNALVPSLQSDPSGFDEATAAFTDGFGTIVGCVVSNWGEAGGAARVELSASPDDAGSPGSQSCPVQPIALARSDDGTLDEYQLAGAGAVRDDVGHVLTDAATITLGIAGDSLTTTHPVVGGIAIIDALAAPEADIHFEWDDPPTVEGSVYDAEGTLLATCRG